MDFSLFQGLRLKEVFADNQKFQGVISDEDYLAELFEFSNKGTLFIHDDAIKGYSTFVNDTKGLGADKTFKIDNTTHKDIFLWHIDGVLYKKESKCDCAFLTDSHMRYVEFKSNAANKSEEAIEDNYQNAADQISITHEDIDNRYKTIGLNLKKVLKLEAYAVFNRTVPKNNAHQKKVSAKFFDKNKFRLYFQNSVKIQ